MSKFFFVRVYYVLKKDLETWSVDPVPQTRISTATHDVDLITLVIALIRARQPESKLVSSPCSAITLEYYSY